MIAAVVSRAVVTVDVVKELVVLVWVDVSGDKSWEDDVCRVETERAEETSIVVTLGDATTVGVDATMAPVDDG